MFGQSGSFNLLGHGRHKSCDHVYNNKEKTLILFPRYYSNTSFVVTRCQPEKRRCKSACICRPGQPNCCLMGTVIVAIKDNICAENVPTMGSSAMLRSK